jgi:hypothetical protein
MIDNPLTPFSMNTPLRNSDILSSGRIGDWIPFEDDMTGCIGWYHRDDIERDRIVWATPHWETVGVVPVELSTDEDYHSLYGFELNVDDTIVNQLNEYRTELGQILNRL